MREKTREEVREAFLSHVRVMVDYWKREAASGRAEDPVEGIAHSILVALDGGASGLPKFLVAPDPHPDDRAFREQNDEDWYPPAPEVPCDIAGHLHECFHARGTRR